MPHGPASGAVDPPEVAVVKVLRWVVAGLLLGAAAAFLVELLLPRRRSSAGSSGYLPPRASSDRHAVLRG